MIRNIFFLSCWFIVSTHVSDANEKSIDHASINRALVEKVIIKDYANLARSSILLKQKLMQLCLSASSENAGDKINPEIASDATTKATPKLTIKDLQEPFLDLRQAWAQVQLISFGPISFLERRERFDYWPDKHRVGERQLRQLLSQKNPLNWTIEHFQQKSVAVQGLGALERLLFSQNKHLNPNHCELANLIATNLENIATEVSMQWSQKPIEFKNDLLNPEPDLTFFTSPKEVTSVLLNDMSTQLRFLSDIKIANALPKKTSASSKKIKKNGNFRQLESWRTGETFALMKANIMSVENYYRQGFSIHLIKYEPNTHQQIMTLFKRALGIVKVLDSQAELRMNQLLTKPDNLELLRNLQSMLLDIDILFKNDIVSALNLNIKFNALDGD